MLRSAPSLKRPYRLTRKRVHRALFLELKTAEPEGKYGIRYSPLFWKQVFQRAYRVPPDGPDDLRWDPLFRFGFPLLRRML